MLEQMPQDIDANDYLKDANLQLNQALNTYFGEFYRQTCYVGLSLKQGKRKMLQINVPAHDLPRLLQAKPPENNNDPDSGKNRREVKGHVKEIKDYILSRVEQDKPWILGTLTANVDPKNLEILELGRGICLVIIPRGIKLDITDGQHRKRAIHELIESSKGTLIGDNDIPITLVLEADLKQCQTDFRDMAQTKALDKSLLHSFGEYEGCVGIVKNLIDIVPMFTDKTNKITDRPKVKEKHIYTVNYLTKMVGCAFANNANTELRGFDVDEATKTLSACLNQFFSECQQTKHIYEIPVYDLTVEQIQYFQDNCVLGRSVGVEILGRLLHSIYDNEIVTFDSFKVSQLAQLDWSASNELWHDNVVKVNPNPKNPAKLYKFSPGHNLVKIAIEKVKQQLGWINSYPNNNTLF